MCKFMWFSKNYYFSSFFFYNVYLKKNIFKNKLLMESFFLKNRYNCRFEVSIKFFLKKISRIMSVFNCGIGDDSLNLADRVFLKHSFLFYSTLLPFLMCNNSVFMFFRKNVFSNQFFSFFKKFILNKSNFTQTSINCVLPNFLLHFFKNSSLDLNVSGDDYLYFFLQNSFEFEIFEGSLALVSDCFFIQDYVFFEIFSKIYSYSIILLNKRFVFHISGNFFFKSFFNHVLYGLDFVFLKFFYKSVFVKKTQTLVSEKLNNFFFKSTVFYNARCRNKVRANNKEFGLLNDLYFRLLKHKFAHKIVIKKGVKRALSVGNINNVVSHNIMNIKSSVDKNTLFSNTLILHFLNKFKYKQNSLIKLTYGVLTPLAQACFYYYNYFFFFEKFNLIWFEKINQSDYSHNINVCGNFNFSGDTDGGQYLTSRLDYLFSESIAVPADFSITTDLFDFYVSNFYRSCIADNLVFNYEFEKSLVEIVDSSYLRCLKYGTEVTHKQVIWQEIDLYELFSMLDVLSDVDWECMFKYINMLDNVSSWCGYYDNYNSTHLINQPLMSDKLETNFMFPNLNSNSYELRNFFFKSCFPNKPFFFYSYVFYLGVTSKSGYFLKNILFKNLFLLRGKFYFDVCVSNSKNFFLKQMFIRNWNNIFDLIFLKKYIYMNFLDFFKKKNMNTWLLQSNFSNSLYISLFNKNWLLFSRKFSKKVLKNRFIIFQKSEQSVYTNKTPITFFSVFLKRFIFKKLKAQSTPTFFKYISLFIIPQLETFLGKTIIFRVVPISKFKHSVKKTLDKIFLKKRTFQSRIGRGFFLNEMLEILYLTFNLKDLNFLKRWFLLTMERIQFSKHKKFLSVFKNITTNYSDFLIFGNDVGGFFLDVRGKVGVTGDAKKRNFYISIGKRSKTTKNSKYDYQNGVVRTTTGQLGITMIMYYVK